MTQAEWNRRILDLIEARKENRITQDEFEERYKEMLGEVEKDIRQKHNVH